MYIFTYRIVLKEHIGGHFSFLFIVVVAVVYSFNIIFIYFWQVVKIHNHVSVLIISHDGQICV